MKLKHICAPCNKEVDDPFVHLLEVHPEVFNGGIGGRIER